MKVGIYKTNEFSIVPEFATEYAACFDLRANLQCDSVHGFTSSNIKTEISVMYDKDNQERFVEICPGARLLIPTGLIFAIEPGYSMRLHPRSSFSLKKGLTLSNAQGIIDSDYTNEVFICLQNTSSVKELVYHADRVCQAEIVKSNDKISLEFEEIVFPPSQIGNRTGGFGSTGVK